MKSFFVFCTLFLLACFSNIYAQKKISGTVRDSASQHGLGYVSLGLFRLPDSALVQQTTSDEKGAFAFNGLDAGTYRLRSALVGYKRLDIQVNMPADADKAFHINMIPADNILPGVSVTEEIIPVMMVGDTIQYNAGAYKVKENAVAEDLLKKLPGIEVDRQGNIKAMGENVRQVLVDGKPFFGDDPKAATKNLPADAIDNIKVYDKRSDQSNFSGFDDGSGEKVVDIRLKADRRRGRFGRFTGGYGTEERFVGSAMYNHFAPKEQISLLGTANNVNDQGFSFEEMLQTGMVSMGSGGGIAEGDAESSGGMMLRGGGMSSGGQNNGIARSFSTGLNYWRDFSSHFALDGNLMLNGSDTRLEQQLFRQNFFADSTVNYRQSSSNRDQRINPRLRLEADWRLDSFNTLKIKTNGSYTDRESENLRDFGFSLPNKSPYLSGKNDLNSDIQRGRGAASVLWKHAYRRPGKTFSATLSANWQPGDVLTNNQQFAQDTLLQRSTQEDANWQYGLKLSYTQPMRKRNRFLEYSYAANNSIFASDKNTFDYDTETRAYSERNAFFSNGLTYNFFNQQAGLNYRRSRLRYDYAFGLAVQHSYLDAAAEEGGASVEKPFVHLLPNASVRFSFKKSETLRFRLNSSIRPPAARSLLAAPDNTNPQTLRLGNPQLRPEQYYTLQANYQNFNMENMSTAMFSGNVSYIRDRISNDIQRTPGLGQQRILPINTTAGLNANAFMVWSKPLSNKRFRVSSNVVSAFSTGYGFLDGRRNTNDLWVNSGGARLSYEKGDWLFVELSGNISYNINRNSASIPASNRFWNYIGESVAQLSLPKGWRLNADFSYNYYGAQDNVPNNDFALLNASIGKSFLKRQMGFLELAVNDALNQNLGVERSTGDGFFEEVNNRILRRYFMLRFTYRLAPKGSGGGGGNGREIKIRF